MYDRNPIPRHVKAMVRHRTLRGLYSSCEDCGKTRIRLEFHHLRYYDVDEQIFGKETPDDLALLCRDCHHNRHVFMGRFYEDPQDRDAAAGYGI